MRPKSYAFTLKYKEEPLTFVKAKSAGKNPGYGFYQSEVSQTKYFIKSPKKIHELFTELFAGRFLERLKREHIIPAEFHASFVCADAIDLSANGKCGLIQPTIEFVELHRMIGTTNSKGNDRNVFFEMLFGRNKYPTLVRNGLYTGLAIALLYSMILGDYSFHSGNVIYTEKDGVKKFGRIDWGAALRFYGDKNNTDLMIPRECVGSFKSFTKNYISFYNIPGLFEAVSYYAKELRNKLAKDQLKCILYQVVKGMPHHVFENHRKMIADYICIPAFENVDGANEENILSFVEKLTDIMYERIIKASRLVEVVRNQKRKSADYYKEIKLTDENKTDFFHQLHNLYQQINTAFPQLKDPETSAQCLLLHFRPEDLQTIADSFNMMVDHLAASSRESGFWQDSLAKNENIFSDYKENNKASDRFLIKHYREEILLKRIFKVDIETLHKNEDNEFAIYEELQAEYIKKYPKSRWSKLHNTLIAAQNVLHRISVMYYDLAPYAHLMSHEARRECLNKLCDDITDFTNNYIELRHELNPENFQENRSRHSCSVFYPISVEELEKYTENQLMTICREEILIPDSIIIATIINRRSLYERLMQGDWTNLEAKSILEKQHAQQEVFDSVCAANDNAIDVLDVCAQLDPVYHQMSPALKQLNIVRLEAIKSRFNPQVWTSAENSEDNRGKAIDILLRHLLSDKKYFDELRKDTGIQFANGIIKLEQASLLVDKNFLIEIFENSDIRDAYFNYSGPLTREVIQDIKLLHAFKENHLKKTYGTEYRKSINDFYQKSIQTCLSTIPKGKQIERLEALADAHFAHRDWAVRLLADALMVITIIGLSVGVIRAYNRNSFFFSAAPTARRNQVVSQLNYHSEEAPTVVCTA